MVEGSESHKSRSCLLLPAPPPPTTCYQIAALHKQCKIDEDFIQYTFKFIHNFQGWKTWNMLQTAFNNRSIFIQYWNKGWKVQHCNVVFFKTNASMVCVKLQWILLKTGFHFNTNCTDGMRIDFNQIHWFQPMRRNTMQHKASSTNKKMTKTTIELKSALNKMVQHIARLKTSLIWLNLKMQRNYAELRSWKQISGLSDSIIIS